MLFVWSSRHCLTPSKTRAIKAFYSVRCAAVEFFSRARCAPLALIRYIVFAVWPALARAIYGWFFGLFWRRRRFGRLTDLPRCGAILGSAGIPRDHIIDDLPWGQCSQRLEIDNFRGGDGQSVGLAPEVEGEHQQTRAHIPVAALRQPAPVRGLRRWHDKTAPGSEETDRANRQRFTVHAQLGDLPLSRQGNDNRDEDRDHDPHAAETSEEGHELLHHPRTPAREGQARGRRK